MRIIHALFSFGRPPGIIKQIEEEEKAAELVHASWIVKFGLPGLNQPEVKRSKFRKQVSKIVYRVNYFFQLWKEAQPKDVVLLRYAPCDIFQCLFVMRSQSKVILLHHTMEVPELRLIKGWGMRFWVWLEVVVGFVSRNCADGICAVTDEIRIHQMDRRKRWCPSFLYPNGMLLDENKIELLGGDKDLDNEPIRILFVASDFVPWHGLDRLLADVANSSLDFTLHVVGKVHAEHRVAAAGDQRVIFHGMLTSDELLPLMLNSDVGLSCFALDRKGMKEACPLKVREYLAHGLPVYSGHSDVFSEDAYFYRKGECSIDNIIGYVKEVSAYDRIQIMNDSRVDIDKKLIMKSLISQIAGSKLL